MTLGAQSYLNMGAMPRVGYSSLQRGGGLRRHGTPVLISAIRSGGTFPCTKKVNWVSKYILKYAVIWRNSNNKRASTTKKEGNIDIGLFAKVATADAAGRGRVPGEPNFKFAQRRPPP